jgi:predicted ATPase
MYIKSITLENIKRFEDVTLEFQRPDGSYAGWNTIVGGNSSGKTTFLRAIALVLAGPESAFRLTPNTSGWLTKSAKAGRVVLALTRDSGVDTISQKGKFPDTNFPAGLRWLANTDDVPPTLKAYEERSKSGLGGFSRVPATRGPWDPKQKGWFLAGYGPMRRLTGSAPDAMRFAAGGGPAARLISLFREDVALSESEEWLKNMQFKSLEDNPEAKELVTQVTDFLNDGLLPNGFAIERITSEHVYIRTGSGPTLPMRDISDGYRSIYALILDIIHSFGEVYGMSHLFELNASGRRIINKPGVILIDEVEAHLHPKWQRIICSWFKERFPRIQFLVTTHSPLVVQAADPGGIFVLPMPGESNRKARRLDEHEYLKIVFGRAEKVLLGEAFNLHETRGQWAVNQIEKWKELTAKKAAGVELSQEEKVNIVSLQKEMALVADEEL